MWGVYKNKSRQAATFEMGLGSSFLEKVVIPYANSPSTNPSAKVRAFRDSANYSVNNRLFYCIWRRRTWRPGSCSGSPERSVLEKWYGIRTLGAIMRAALTHCSTVIV